MADEYEFETEVQVRYRDVDEMGHVNNAVYATYLEQARTAYFREVIGTSLAETSIVLASLSIDFRNSIKLGDEVTVALSVPKLGDSSIPMEYEIRLADGAVAATGETVQVAFDREERASRPIPEEWREAIEAV